MDPNKIPIKATTQEHLNVEDIQDNLVILKDGSVCLIMQTSAVNFGLLSEQEQDATIFAYAGLLNSLTFSIQILIKSQKKDISSYLRLLKREEDKQKNEQLKNSIQKYRFFVESTVRENNVLDKKFYIVVPFSTLELGIKGAGGVLSGGFKKGLPFPKSYILEKAKIALFPKRDHLIRQFNRIGLKIEQLNTKQLIELFFKTYNPESFGIQQPAEPLEYEKPIVEAAIIKQGAENENSPVSSPPQSLPVNNLGNVSSLNVSPFKNLTPTPSPSVSQNPLSSSSVSKIPETTLFSKTTDNLPAEKPTFPPPPVLPPFNKISNQNDSLNKTDNINPLINKSKSEDTPKILKQEPVT